MPTDSTSATSIDLQLLEAAVAQSYNAVLITNACMDGEGPTIIYCNHAFCAMTGYSQAELIGQSPRILQGPGTDPKVIERLRQSLLDGSFFNGSTLNYRKDGTAYHLQWNISAILDAAGSTTHYVSVQQDVSRLIEAQEQRNLLANALNASSSPILISDHKSTIVFANHAFELESGYCSEEICGQTTAIFANGYHSARFYSELNQALERGEHFSRTFIQQHKDGSLYHSRQSISPIRDSDDQVTHFVSVGRDVSEARLNPKDTVDQHYRDDLTNLLSRSAGGKEIHQCHTLASTIGTPYSLILCDIDDFAHIETRQASAKRVLLQVAQLLQGSIRSCDRIARWGSQEFLIILPSIKLRFARELAERLRLKVARQDFPQAGNLTLSIGVTCWKLGMTPASLLQEVDNALYRAQNQGCNQVVSAHGAEP